MWTVFFFSFTHSNCVCVGRSMAKTTCASRGLKKQKAGRRGYHWRKGYTIKKGKGRGKRVTGCWVKDGPKRRGKSTKRKASKKRKSTKRKASKKRKPTKKRKAQSLYTRQSAYRKAAAGCKYRKGASNCVAHPQCQWTTRGCRAHGGAGGQKTKYGGIRSGPIGRPRSYGKPGVIQGQVVGRKRQRQRWREDLGGYGPGYVPVKKEKSFFGRLFSGDTTDESEAELDILTGDQPELDLLTGDVVL